MIFVDSSVWVDYFRGTSTPEAEKLDSLLASEPLVIGDLVLVEVLQGFDRDSDFNQARKLLTSLARIQVIVAHVLSCKSSMLGQVT